MKGKPGQQEKADTYQPTFKCTGPGHQDGINYIAYQHRRECGNNPIVRQTCVQHKKSEILDFSQERSLFDC